MVIRFKIHRASVALGLITLLTSSQSKLKNQDDTFLLPQNELQNIIQQQWLNKNQEIDSISEHTSDIENYNIGTWKDLENSDDAEDS